ncbi:RNA-directed DNA polymerase [Mesorhizobium sp. M4B.F.Ca.ET.017.02.2.1]|nr:RNA-directed DNA polymerase [Mesorhizobium sp. M4B.F.Ca.ET.017.02.2.1]
MQKSELISRNINVIFDGLTEAQIAAVQSYSASLADRDLPTIYSPVHLCQVVGVSPQYLFAVSNDPKRFYRGFSIPKRNGGRRFIQEPLPLLKAVQRWLLANILEKVGVSPFVKSYIKGINLKHNSRFHIGQDFVFKLDLESFFDRILTKDVVEVFYKAGYTRDVSIFLAKICVSNGRLCQGSPTSGAISNIVLLEFDLTLFEFCRSRGFRYTRYSDDITISGKMDAGTNFHEILLFISELASANGHKINKGKSQVLYRHNRQKVTGIVVNEKLTVPRPVRRRFRQELFYFERYGPRGHAERIGEGLDQCVARLIGQASHLLFVRPDDEFVRVKKDLLLRVLRQMDADPQFGFDLGGRPL